MDWRRDWQMFAINNESFLFSVINESDENVIFNLSDFKVLWRERITWQEILSRAKSENPFMSVDREETAIERTLSSLADHYQYNAKDDELLLKLKYYISGVPFHFYWKLTKSSSDEFFEEITKKLLVTLLNVQEQRNELIEVIKRKDTEISQYKMTGATLLRTTFATQPFVKQEFDRKFELTNDFGLFDGSDSSNTMKNMCNYIDFTKKDDPKVIGNTLNKQNGEGPSPIKIAKKYSREVAATRKFQNKREVKIQYQNSCEDGSSQEEISLESDNVRHDEETTKDQTNNVPLKRKLIRSKLNL